MFSGENRDMMQTQWWKMTLKTATMLLTLTIVAAAEPQKHEKHKAKDAQSDLPAVIWQDPGNISSLNLIYGTGGQENAPDPNGTYTFLKEDMNGTSPKFDVKDANSVKWRIKTGAEPQSETAATRLLWAAGYFVDQDYYLAEVRVEGLPKLHRGENYVREGVVHGARLERKDERIKKTGNWDWFNNRFKGTRELNGLRVMMALLNNWDLKEINNSIYVVDGQQRYVVSDVGASFGKTGSSISRSKSDEEGYEKSGFIEKQTDKDVDFEMHSRPFLPTFVNLPNYRGRTKMEEITKHIPRADAKWIGGLLGQLTEEQIRDCFRSAGYSPEEVEGYASEVRKRIAALNAL
jgi:hypothetical protein